MSRTFCYMIFLDRKLKPFEPAGHATRRAAAGASVLFRGWRRGYSAHEKVRGSAAVLGGYRMSKTPAIRPVERMRRPDVEPGRKPL